MVRRGLIAGFLAMMFTASTAGIGFAAGPTPTPPPQCFVIKNGALPTCDQNPDGTWNVRYPEGGGNLDDGGHSNTKRTIGLLVMLAAIAGIGIIVFRTWVRPTGAQPAAAPAVPTDPPRARLSGASVEPQVRPGAVPPHAQPSPPSPAAPAPAAKSAAQQLAELNALRNQGAISQDEYESRRSSIVGESG
jgi:hypothetical protein